MMAGVEILEGFLCPICVQDLGSVARLQDHFEEAHAGEDRALLNQLKGLFGKAKRKILGQENELGDASFQPVASDQLTQTSTAIVGGTDPALWEPQELGVTRNLTDSFKMVRDSRIDRFVIETNKLLIRLDKLVNSDFPSEPSKRKVFEKTVVQWAPDSDVNLCTTCGKQFTLTRRRHHCRLCGRILCNKCSHFMPFEFAKKLTNPAVSYDGEGFRRSSSNSSLNSIFSPEGDPHIRTCNECRLLLERRDEQMSQRAISPVIVQLYERTRTHMTEAEKVLPQFSQMADSLNAGDTTYSLHEAQELRLKLTKLYENIGSLSKRIAVLGLDNPEAPTPKSLRLQQMISAHASAFLQENLLGLSTLPTEDELARLRDAKTIEAKKRIAEERRVSLEHDRRRREEQQLLEEQALERQNAAMARDSTTGRPRNFGANIKFNAGSDERVQVCAGWKPAEVAAGVSGARRGDEKEDPMIQQMNIIRSYIRQAQDARKWDEVQMLKENLKELQQEYWVQQQQEQSQQLK